MKCDICSAKIEETFLKKPVGTYVKDSKGKKHIICPGCQREHGAKDSILEKI